MCNLFSHLWMKGIDAPELSDLVYAFSKVPANLNMGTYLFEDYHAFLSGVRIARFKNGRYTTR